jgi:hypothetical protein
MCLVSLSWKRPRDKGGITGGKNSMLPFDFHANRAKPTLQLDAGRKSSARVFTKQGQPRGRSERTFIEKTQAMPPAAKNAALPRFSVHAAPGLALHARATAKSARRALPIRVSEVFYPRPIQARRAAAVHRDTRRFQVAMPPSPPLCSVPCSDGSCGSFRNPDDVSRLPPFGRQACARRLS